MLLHVTQLHMREPLMQISSKLRDKNKSWKATAELTAMFAQSYAHATIRQRKLNCA